MWRNINNLSNIYFISTVHNKYINGTNIYKIISYSFVWEMLYIIFVKQRISNILNIISNVKTNNGWFSYFDIEENPIICWPGVVCCLYYVSVRTSHFLKNVVSAPPTWPPSMSQLIRIADVSSCWLCSRDTAAVVDARTIRKYRNTRTHTYIFNIYLCVSMDLNSGLRFEVYPTLIYKS